MNLDFIHQVYLAGLPDQPFFPFREWFHEAFPTGFFCDPTFPFRDSQGMQRSKSLFIMKPGYDLQYTSKDIVLFSTSHPLQNGDSNQSRIIVLWPEWYQSHGKQMLETSCLVRQTVTELLQEFQRIFETSACMTPRRLGEYEEMLKQPLQMYLHPGELSLQ